MKQRAAGFVKSHPPPGSVHETWLKIPYSNVSGAPVKVFKGEY